MSRKGKVAPIEKVKIVEQYLNGEISLRQAGKIAGIAFQSVAKWIDIYKSEGPTGLLNQYHNRSYSKELKLSAVNEYLNDHLSLDKICEK